MNNCNWNDQKPQTEDETTNDITTLAKQQERDYKKQQRQTLKIQCISLAQEVKGSTGETGDAAEILKAAKSFYDFART